LMPDDSFKKLPKFGKINLNIPNVYRSYQVTDVFVDFCCFFHHLGGDVLSIGPEDVVVSVTL
jgi:hypothetical protein